MGREALEVERESATIARYEIVRPLGVGGMATVHLAQIVENGTSRKVAIKRLHDFIANDPMNVAILEDEARLASCIHHPNVVGIIDLIEGNGGAPPVLVMEWVEGLNLAALSAAVASSGRRLPLDVVGAIVRDVLAGLHAAHEAKRDDGLALEIVHRDVSPHNILVGFDGVARITDFGVAKAAWRQQQTELGAIKGKLGYMAPEQLEGYGDRSADIYAVGVVLWELLTGKRLRTADGEGAQVLVQILQNLVVAPSTLEPSVASLDAIAMRALSRNPADRFATASEMREALLSQLTPASNERVAAVVRDILDAGSLSSLSLSRDSEIGAEPVRSAKRVRSSTTLACFAVFAATLLGCGSAADVVGSSEAQLFDGDTQLAIGCTTDADCGPSARCVATSRGEIVSHPCGADAPARVPAAPAPPRMKPGPGPAPTGGSGAQRRRSSRRLPVHDVRSRGPRRHSVLVSSSRAPALRAHPHTRALAASTSPRDRLSVRRSTRVGPLVASRGGDVWTR
jgi:serine/threonine protein kinase